MELKDSRKLRPKKVALVEVLWHHDVLTAFLKLSSNFNELHTIGITCQKIYDQLDEKDFNNVDLIQVPDPYLHFWSSLNKFKKIIHLPKLLMTMYCQGKNLSKIINSLELDIIVFNTLAAPFYFKFFFDAVKKNKIPIKLIVVVHNSHFWSVRYFLNEMRLSDITKGKIFSLLFNLMNVKTISAAIKLGEYVVLPNSLNNIPITTIPNRLSENKLIKNRNFNTVTFVITGGVTQERKDYISIFKAFKKIFKETPSYKKKTKLVLLGKLKDEKVRKIIEKYELKHWVKYYENFVSEEEFNKQLSYAHYVIIPINSAMPYGKYKISGSLGDAISNGKPIILSSEFAPDYQFGENVLRFNTNNPAFVLKKAIDIVLIKKDKYLIMENEAICQMQQCSSEKVASNLERFLNNI